MTFDPSIGRPFDPLTEADITYSGEPPLAEIPAGYRYEAAEAWVRERGKPLMMPDGDSDHYAVLYRDPQTEQVVVHAVWGVTDKGKATAQIRDLLDKRSAWGSATRSGLKLRS